MKKTNTTTRKKAAAKAGPKPISDVHNMASDVVNYLEDKAKNIDKATLAKYIAVAVLVIYGVRKSNVLGSLAISLITGIATKFLADKMDGSQGDLIPEAIREKI